ncbi:energy transducer TonB [Capnocytophaga leadbetteri]|uniref:energy transducer TonB n=1 Tax=Capnocytophaga leadbetteri TaxID=327575 RepID=UPI0028F0B812|nr:energy transducer TonB [Capnocytophaga leadbetteri]
MKLLPKVLLVLCLAVVANSYAQQEIVAPSDDERPVDIPYFIIEEKPMFEACKELPDDRQFQCFKEQLDKHVNIHFRYPPEALAEGIEGKMYVYVAFRINTDGTVSIIGKRAANKILEEEAVFLIRSLPCFIPGKMRGVPTAVTYAYFFNFKLPDDYNNPQISKSTN